jgi:adenylate cyclase
VTTDWTFSMVDLAGFTALTEAHGDDHAADLAVQLVDIATSHLNDGDVVVKSIGDAVLLASPSPRAALQLVERVLATCAEQDQFLGTRVGLHSGPAVQRGNDFFGATVNLTARVANEAQAGQVLGTRDVAEAARQLNLSVTALGAASLKNVSEPVELYELGLRLDDPSIVIDPTCRMRLRPEEVDVQLRHDGIDYWFCSTACAEQFQREHT